MGKFFLHIRCVIFSFLLVAFGLQVTAQYAGKKNTAYVNVTNPLLFGSKAFIIGYERVIGKHQSISVNIGRMSLPKFGKGADNDSVSLQRNSNDKGLHLSAEYRFYLAGENKYEAPRGVYIGPYYSYNHFSRSNDWLLNTTSFTGDVNSDLGLTINTVGVEFGYQFVFWKRLSLDLILFGPGIASYKVKTSLNTTLSAEEEALFFEKLNGYLQDKIPGYNMVIKEGDFKRTGSTNTTSFGFRYMVNIGFRF
jgi:hypothetical protein